MLGNSWSLDRVKDGSTNEKDELDADRVTEWLDEDYAYYVVMGCCHTMLYYYHGIG